MLNRDLLHPRDIFDVADVPQFIDRVFGDRERLRKPKRSPFTVHRSPFTFTVHRSPFGVPPAKYAKVFGQGLIL
jgi:hypothetical protein